jgi:hypothetical protein
MSRTPYTPSVSSIGSRDEFDTDDGEFARDPIVNGDGIIPINVLSEYIRFLIFVFIFFFISP